MRDFNPADAYWQVVEVGNDVRWHSRRCAWVPNDDAEYMRWSEWGGFTPVFETIGDLDTTLRHAGQTGCRVTTDDVRAEASRRMQMLTGARNAEHLTIVLSNAMREAVRLQDVRLAGAAWTVEQSLRAAQLRAADAAIEAIRAASNAIEGNPPPDYNDDRFWPK